MLKVLSCIVYEHDLGLVVLSAIICVLGCFTTAVMMGRAVEPGIRSRRWLVAAAVVFGCSVWSLHFVGMLAFTPASGAFYELGLTAWSAIMASAGAVASFLVWRSPWPRAVRLGVAALLLCLAVTGTHSLGIAAMGVSGLVTVEPFAVLVSVAVAIPLFLAALIRAVDMEKVNRRIEVAAWLAAAICTLHFTGMSAVTFTPLASVPGGPQIIGTTALAIAVGAVSVMVLVMSLAAVLVEQYMSRLAHRELSRMRLLSNLAHEVLLIHRDGLLLEVNSAGERLFKAPAKQMIGQLLSSLFTPDSAPALIRCAGAPGEERCQERLVFQAVDGTNVPVELSCQSMHYLGRPATVLALRDLTDRMRDEARILHLARHDTLTNLPNRHNLLERLEIALNTAGRHGGRLAVLHIDLNRFRAVNDLHGHATGDALLIQAGKRLLAEIQSVDLLARIGGDEFIMVLTSDPHPESASMVATQVIEEIGKPFMIEGSQVETGASIGIALYPDDGATADSLMRAADAAMHRVKEAGESGLRFYEASMNAQLQARLQLRQELAGAIGRDELVLHYQPLVNGVTGALETFEALIRWNNPRRGVVSPAEFIPLAEEAGLIDMIGRWVIETACREAAGWDQPWRVAVNVSPRQFGQSDVYGIVDAALQLHGLSPKRLVIEVTEGILIEDAATAVDTLNRLQEIGVRVALDDFGTGYSSLSYLQFFRFDKFKIDKSFVKKLGESDHALTLTRTIINLGHNLGLHVTAEGVETVEQLAILRRLGCDQVQGYLIGRPAPVELFSTQWRLRVAALFNEDAMRLSA